jgi:UDPglucose 6-dehydrogenase
MKIDNDISAVTILGTGYVGLSTAALFAAAGIKTYVIDPNKARLDSVRRGKSFFYEEGLDSLIAESISKGLIIATDSYKIAVPNSDIIISSVGTPQTEDGSTDLSYVLAAATEASKYLQPGSIYVQKSTVPVGTGTQIKNIFQKAGINIAYVSNPEFLRESTAIRDSLWFDRIVVGSENDIAMNKVISLYKRVEVSRETIANIAEITAPLKYEAGKYIKTSIESAELIKVVSNAFLATKISFANSIAKLADAVNADITEVMDAVGADSRIGRSFLNAGRGYGGGCLPKDVNGLISTGFKHGIDLKAIQAVQDVNESMPDYIITKLASLLRNKLEGKKIAVLGLAFKEGTSDVRRSPSIAIANKLADEGALVKAYDPQALEEAKPELNKKIVTETNISDAIEDADAVIIATDWHEITSFKLEDYAVLMSGNILFDTMNRLDIDSVNNAGLRYVGIGRDKTGSLSKSLTQERELISA